MHSPSKSPLREDLRTFITKISASLKGRDLFFRQSFLIFTLYFIFQINVFALNSLPFGESRRGASLSLWDCTRGAFLPFTDSRSEVLISKGLDYCYNFKWDKAENTFKDIIEKYPDSPDGYHYLSSVYFWYYLSSKNEDDLNSFKKYSDHAINKAQEQLEKKEDDAELLYLIGSNYNYRTIAFAKAENYLDAVWAAKKSESYLSDCLNADSSFTDAYLGLGLYNFAVANIPSGFKWALNLAGISGEESTGLRYIRVSADRGNLAKVEAQYYLSQILSEVIMDFDAASDYLKNLTRKYPDNLLFNYSYAAVEMKKRKLDEAEKVLNKIVKKEEPKFSQIISFSNFLLGDIYFRRNQFNEAKNYYQKFLSSANGKDYTGIASYRLAIVFEIAGDRQNAKKYFSLAQKGNMDIEDDIYAKRKGEIYYERTLAQSEIEIVKTGNLVESGKYAEAMDSLVNMVSEVKTGKLKAEVYLIMSEAAFYRNRFDESVDYALNAAKINAGDESWIKPFAYFYAARSLAAADKKQEAKKYLDMAEDHSGYDYQKKLENMINALSKKI